MDQPWRSSSELTERVKVETQVDRLRDGLVRIARRVDPRRLYRERIEPNPHAGTIVSPERVLEGTDTLEVGPVHLDPLGEDLHVVPDFITSSLIASARCQRRQ